MKRWLIAATAITLLVGAPVALADRNHDSGRAWHQEHDRRDDRLRMRVRKPHVYHDRRDRRENGWHHDHLNSRWHGDDHRRHHHGYRDHRGGRHHDRHQAPGRHNLHGRFRHYYGHRDRVVFGIGDDRQGVLIWKR